MRKITFGLASACVILASTLTITAKAQSFSSGPEKARIIFEQIGGETGILYIKHKKLGPGKGRYVLKKNQNIYHKLKIGAVCGQGFSLKQLSYKLESEPLAQVFYQNYNSDAPRSYSKTATIRVFNDNTLLNALRDAMGGQWYHGFSAEERVKKKTISLSQKIKITRFCAKPNGALVKVSKLHKIKIKKLKIVDLDY